MIPIDFEVDWSKVKVTVTFSNVLSRQRLMIPVIICRLFSNPELSDTDGATLYDDLIIRRGRSRQQVSEMQIGQAL